MLSETNAVTPGEWEALINLWMLRDIEEENSLYVRLARFFWGSSWASKRLLDKRAALRVLHHEVTCSNKQRHYYLACPDYKPECEVCGFFHQFYLPVYQHGI